MSHAYRQAGTQKLLPSSVKCQPPYHHHTHLVNFITAQLLYPSVLVQGTHQDLEYFLVHSLHFLVNGNYGNSLYYDDDEEFEAGDSRDSGSL